MGALIHIGAIAAIVGGALRIFAPLFYATKASFVAEAYFAFIDVCFLIGLLALYVAWSDKLGWLGLAFFIAALSSIASIVGPDPVAWGVDFYRLGAAAASISLAGLALVMLWRDVLTQAALFWIASFAVGVFAIMAKGEAAFIAAGILFALGFTSAGVGTLMRGGEVSGSFNVWKEPDAVSH